MSTINLGELKGDEPLFDSISINIEHVAKVLQAYIIEGSKTCKVSAEDLSVYAPEGVNSTNATVSELMKGGTKIFDAIYYCSLPLSDRREPAAALPADSILTVDKVADALFFCFFMLLTQARPPAPGVQVGNFLKGIMGAEHPPEYYANAICSFNLSHVDHRWIRHINMNGMSQEAIARFSLGVAGYRLLTATFFTSSNAVFASTLNVTEAEFNTLKSLAAENAKRLQSLCEKGASWELHPTTRSPVVLSRFKSLNKAISDMLCFLFNDATLKIMVDQKVIFSRPQPNAANRNWRSWNDSSFMMDLTPIFLTERS